MAAERRGVTNDIQGRINRMAVMRKASGAADTKAQIPEGGGSGLSSDVRAKMEPKLGADLSGVRVHTGGASQRSATEFGARAYTVGSDIHFNAGEFNPGSKEGDKLLAHELTHVVQGQKSGVQRKPADGDDHGHEVSEPGEPAEQEADAVAEKTADELHDGSADGKAAGKKPKAGKEKDHTPGAEKEDEQHGDKTEAKEAAPAIGAKLQGVAFKIFRAEGPKQGDHVFNKGLGKMGSDLSVCFAAVTGVQGTDIRASASAFTSALSGPAMELVVSKGAAPEGGDANSKAFGTAKASFLQKLTALCTAYGQYQKANGAEKSTKKTALAGLAASATAALDTLFNSCVDESAISLVPKKDKALIAQGRAAQAAAKSVLAATITKLTQ